MPVVTPPASSIGVFHAEQILWLPLRVITKGDSPWLADWENDTAALQPGRKGGVEDDESYGEFLYFHPTLRRFIWGDSNPSSPNQRPLQRWRPKHERPGKYLDVLLAEGRSDPEQAAEAQPNGDGTLQLKNPPHRLRLKVEDLCLYVVGQRPALVIVALHWSVDTKATPCTLAQLQDMLDCVRRTHMGYFPGEVPDEQTGGTMPLQKLAGGRVPLAAQWSNEDAPAPLAIDRAALASQKREMVAAVAARNTPLLSHWRQMLGNTLAQGTEQIEDERMPYMAYVRVADPTLISRADWVRLVVADDRGPHDALPYGTSFLADFEQKHCYDRFYDPTVQFKTSRFLNAGYAFTMVGAEGNDFFKKVSVRHFSGHYAWMGLLLQYNKAALLNFSRRLAESSANLVDGDKANDSEYGDDIRQIQRELVAFTHRHWFDGFTNQIQGQEIGQQWSQLLGLPSLYATVKNEAEMAYQLVLAEEARLQTLEAATQTQQVTKLTKWGLRFGLIGLLLALAGGGFPIDKPFSVWPEGICFTCGIDLPRLTILVVLYVVLGYLAYRLDRRINSQQPSAQSPSPKGSP